MGNDNHKQPSNQKSDESMNTLPAKKPWQRWPDETDTAYHRFSIYLKLGQKRSLEKVRQELGKTTAYKRQLELWSSKYSWVDRCRAYDEHLVLKSLKNKEQILDRGMARLLNMMDKALDELESILDSSDVIPVGQNQTQIITQKLKGIDIVLNRIGLVEQKEVPDTSGGNVTINNYVQNIYEKMRRLDNEEKEGAK